MQKKLIATMEIMATIAGQGFAPLLIINYQL